MVQEEAGEGARGPCEGFRRSRSDFFALGGDFNVDSRMAENWYETIEDVIGHQLFSYLTFRICRDRHDGPVNSRQRCRGDWRRLGKSCRMICRFS